MQSKKTWLVETIKSDQTHELLADGMDSFIGALTDSEVLGNLPFAGTVFKTYKATLGIREIMLVKKLANFLEHPSQMSEAEKLKFSSQFENPEKEEEFGELMLTLLDKAEDTKKPRIIGKLITAHAKGHINYQELTRLSKMVSNTFTEDLNSLKSLHTEEFYNLDEDVGHSLYANGFVKMKYSSDVGTLGGGSTYFSHYEITGYGKWVVELGLSETMPPAPEPPNTL